MAHGLQRKSDGPRQKNLLTERKEHTLPSARLAELPLPAKAPPAQMTNDILKPKVPWDLAVVFLFCFSFFHYFLL